MPTIELSRTTAFRLAPEHFGTVYIYRPGPRFGRAWEQLERQWKATGDTSEFRKLPYRGLATALRVLSGDFVALQRQIDKHNAFIISRRPIPRDKLETTVGAWEANALGLFDGPISQVVDDLTCEAVEVAEHVHRREGLCPAIPDEMGWVWDVAIWEVARRLAGSLMDTDKGPVSFRLDSDAALLTWDHLVGPEGEFTSKAMHKVVLHLMTVPGVEEPIVSLQSSLVRLAPSWKETGGPRYAWADVAPEAPILRARVRAKKVEGGWQTVWDDRAAEVLRGASLHPLPDTSVEPVPTGVLRAGYTRAPRRHDIGRGVGIWFHECVAHHAKKVLGRTAIPLELKTTRSSWPTRERLAAKQPLVLDETKNALQARFVVVYASSAVRHRVRDALAYVLMEDAPEQDRLPLAAFVEQLKCLPDEQDLRVGPIEVRFVKPPEAERWLLHRSDRGETVGWLESWLATMVRDGVVTAAIVETDESAANGKDELSDPKHVLRGAFAERGIVTQFIAASSTPRSPPRQEDDGEEEFNDYAAANAVGDVMRSAGFFLRPFPTFGVDPETLVVGIYGTRLTRKTTGREHSSYLVNLVAVSIGSQQAWGYAEGKGWLPLNEATAWFLSSDHDLSEQEARDRVEQAVGPLQLVLGGRPVILLFEAYGCRRFWSCLTDKSDGKPPAWMKRGGKAIVRVRTAASEVLRPAGAGEWMPDFTPARHTNFRPMAVVGAQGTAPTFVLSGSDVMSKGISARTSTRLKASAQALKEDWHSLGTTELLVLERGQWEPERLIEQVAMLCRVAPTWDRTLRWPSPLHLARAVVRDHPHRYFADRAAEEEEAEDAEPMRFDFGITG